MSILDTLLVALTTRLEADSTLDGLIPGGLHSGTAPQNEPRAFLVMDQPTEEPFDTLGTFGKYGEVVFNAFSATNKKTYAEVNAILDRVEALLRTPLTLTGHTSAMPRLVTREATVDDDETRHGFARYRFIAMEA